MTESSGGDVSLREAYRRVARNRIVDAAVAVFREKGYVPTSIGDIATAAGVSRGTFYAHFSAKSEVLEPILERATERYGDRYARLPALLRGADRSSLRAWVVEAIEGFADIADLMRPVYEAVDSDAALQTRLYPHNDPIGARDIAAGLHAAGLAADEQRTTVCAAVMAAPLSHFFREQLRGRPVAPDDAAAATVAAWTGILQLLEDQRSGGNGQS